MFRKHQTILSDGLVLSCFNSHRSVVLAIQPCVFSLAPLRTTEPSLLGSVDSTQIKLGNKVQYRACQQLICYRLQYLRPAAHHYSRLGHSYNSCATITGIRCLHHMHLTLSFTEVREDRSLACRHLSLEVETPTFFASIASQAICQNFPFLLSSGC
jgi:hypothetical protein